MSTYGNSYDPKIDQPRLGNQLAAIRHYMLGVGWRTLSEIEQALGYPQASISSQLRHLKKKRFGKYLLEKRRRKPGGSVWEYLVREPAKVGQQTSLL